MRPLFELADEGEVRIDLPDVAGAADVRELLDHERAEMLVELGGRGIRLRLGAMPAPGPTLRLEIDAGLERPRLRRVGRDVLVAEGSTLDDAVAALHLLRTMRRTRADEVVLAPAATADAAIDRLDEEIATTWPSFDRTGTDRAAWRDAHRPDPDDPALLARLQHRVARLGDGHTNVHLRTDVAALPYSARAVEGRLLVADVPVGTPFHELGIRPGDEILGVDVDDLATRVGAPAHCLPWLVGRRILSGPIGSAIELEVRRGDGSAIVASDHPGSSSWPEPIESRRLPSGTGYLRIRRWSVDDHDALDDALHRLNRCERLLVDLRGNAGGSLTAAVAFRRRFLDSPTRIGWVRFSTGDGGLADPAPFDDEPSARIRRRGRTRFLVDGLTYSASEDAILGLRQLAHVDVAGSPTGGGSGRPRLVPLVGDAALTVSTALTYEYNGHCIEGTGITPDLPIPPWTGGPDRGVGAADRSW